MVKVNEIRSSPSKQGSLLGLVLFIIYVNDLPKRLKVCVAFGYADDLKLVTTQPSDIQSDLRTNESWFEENEVNLIEKMQYFLSKRTTEQQTSF